MKIAQKLSWQECRGTDGASERWHIALTDLNIDGWLLSKHIHGTYLDLQRHTCSGLNLPALHYYNLKGTTFIILPQIYTNNDNSALPFIELLQRNKLLLEDEVFPFVRYS